MSHNAQEEQQIAEIKSHIGLREFVTLIAALMATNAFAIDIMLPAMNDIKKTLNVVGENAHHLVIFVYLISFGVSQLFFGPLSDRFGRRKPLLFGLLFYAAASLACAFAPSFTSLLILRAIQGVGAAATRILCVSIVRDLYGGRQMAEVMSIAMMVFMVVPILAPATGQTILLFGPWPLIFILMAVAGIAIAAWVWKRLPETLFAPRPLTFSSVVDGLKIVLSNRVSLCYTLAFSVILAALFASLNTAQQIYDGIYHLGAWFPAAFAAVAAFQALAAFLNSRFVGRLGMRRISHGLLIVFIIAALIWFLWCYFSTGPVPFAVYLILFMILMFSFGAMGANFNALAMEPLGKIAGTASSVFGFLQMIIGAGGGFLISQTFDGTTMPIAAGFLGVGLIAFVLVLIAEKGRLFRGLNAPGHSHTRVVKEMTKD